MARNLNGPSRENVADLIAALAFQGADDPTIAVRLELSTSQVRMLREEFEIPPGETRWVSPHHPSRATASPTGDSDTAGAAQ